MAKGQQRAEGGKFGANPDTPFGRMSDEEQLEDIVQFRVSSREMRTMAILFDQHREAFGWQTKSDMYRELCGVGAKDAVARVGNKDPDLVLRQTHAEELRRSMRYAIRHTELDQALERLEKDIVTLTRAGDLWHIRRLLEEFQQVTEKVNDPVIKARRAEEFDRRWGRMLEGLSRGISLKPSDQKEE